MPRDRHQTRDQIVAAAGRLFYGEGIRAVSVDAVAVAAGVTKKTIYYHFASKDELIAAYLGSRDQPTLDLYARWFSATDGSVSEKIRGLFAAFGREAAKPRWRGCGFMRTTAELANTPGHPAVQAGAAHKKRFEAWLTEALRHESVTGPAAVARQIVILLDGAASMMLVHRDVAYVEAAGDIASLLVEHRSASRIGAMQVFG